METNAPRTCTTVAEAAENQEVMDYYRSNSLWFAQAEVKRLTVERDALLRDKAELVGALEFVERIWPTLKNEDGQTPDIQPVLDALAKHGTAK